MDIEAERLTDPSEALLLGNSGPFPLLHVMPDVEICAARPHWLPWFPQIIHLRSSERSSGLIKNHRMMLLGTKKNSKGARSPDSCFQGDSMVLRWSIGFQGCHHKAPPVRGQSKKCTLVGLETRGPEPSCWQSCVPSVGSRKEPCLACFLFLVVTSNWPSLACSCIPPGSASVSTRPSSLFVCLRLCI